MSDRDLQEEVEKALDWEPSIDPAHIGVSVEDGVVTLAGDVRTDSEKAMAERVALGVNGVTMVVNNVAVRLEGAWPEHEHVELHASALDVKSKIEAALMRSAEIVARRIDVVVADGKVILSGTVHSSFERDEARHAAWAAPGVKEVEDRIAVVPEA